MNLLFRHFALRDKRLEEIYTACQIFEYLAL